ncbi:MAG: 3-deoxy-7-phosphoheptulonate synthase [Chlorobia bacterium]|nr:3-deoxy-7-phosphoheptulonate synthase [Fimbriimonadaceae bacterium]
MIIVMRTGSNRDQVDAVSNRLIELGYKTNPIFGVEKSIVCAIGVPEYDKMEAADQLRSLDGVDDVVFISKPYKFVAKELRGKTVVDVDGVKIGGDEVVMMAGPCTVESEAQLMTTAEAVARGGAKVLRGGAYKPSTSPYSFQGMGLPGLELLKEAGRRFNLKVITEVMHVRKVEEVCEYADILQVGTRNAQNYDLLREVGLSKKPVLLKRGMTARLEEWLLAAEYIASAGNERIILCERGIRTFETHTRNTLDLSSVPALASLTHLPVIVDPSQGTGRRELVPPMSKAAIACGADGLLVEVHPNPDKAIKDGVQSIDIKAYEKLMPELGQVAEAVGRSLGIPVRV